MLVTFSSDSSANVTLLGDVAHQLLIMMGHSGVIPGALMAAEVPGALMQLQHALKELKPHSQPSDDEDDDFLEVSLSHRAIPLIKLLEATIKKETYVTWRSGF